MPESVLTHIDRYQIKSELGRGGMATVYRAWDPRFDRDVAVKVLPKAFTHDPLFRGRFEQEAKVIASLEHAAIVPVYDVGEEADQPYLVMRYMTGGSLSARLKEAPLSLGEAAHLLTRLAPALDHAHEKGIIHRDLKPANILFDRHGDPYIADFGIAKISEASLAFTGSGIIGTPMYMSPEQARGEKNLDGRSDIYALGAILFEILTGKLPYEAETPMGIAMRHITDPVPRILDVNPDLPPGVEAIISRAMAKDRNHRFSTAVEMANLLSAVAEGARATQVDSATQAIASTGVPTGIAPSAPPERKVKTEPGHASTPLTIRLKELTQALPFEDQTRAVRLTQTVFGGALVGIAGLSLALPLLGYPPIQVFWPAIIFMPGLLGFVAMTRVGRSASWLAVPSTIIAGLGLLLFYQNTFSHWASWAYAWALIPAFVGIGLLIGGRWSLNPTMVRRGARLAKWSLIGCAALAIPFEVLFSLDSARPIGRFVILALMGVLGIWLVRVPRHAVRGDRDLAPVLRAGENRRGLGRAGLLRAVELHP